MDRDLIRQGAVLAGAATQVASALALGDSVSDAAGEGESYVRPPGWAFGIWGLIYGTAAAGAIDGIRHDRREDEMPRRVGWPLAAAYAADTAWQLVVPRRRFGVAQAILIGIAAAATTAQDRAAAVESAPRGVRDRIRGAPPTVTARDRLLHAMPAGLLAGWTTAATGISLHDLVVTERRVPSRAGRMVTAGGTFAAVSAIASIRLRSTGGAATASGAAYGAAALWALGTAAIEQRHRAPALAATALAAAVPVVRAIVP